MGVTVSTLVSVFCCLLSSLAWWFFVLFVESHASIAFWTPPVLLTREFNNLLVESLGTGTISASYGTRSSWTLGVRTTPWNTFNPILSLIHLSLSLSLLRYYCLFYPCHEGVRFRPGSFRPGVFYVIFSVGWLGVFTCFLVRGTSRSFLWAMCGVEEEVLVWCGMSWCGVLGWLVWEGVVLKVSWGGIH